MGTVVILILAVIGVSAYFVLSQKKPSEFDKGIDLFNTNQINEAMAVFKQEIANDKFNFQAHFYQAQSHEKLGELDQALKHYKEVLNIGCYSSAIERPAILKKIAAISYAQGYMKEAFSYYLYFLRVYPEDLEANRHIAFMALGKGEFELALPYLEKVRVADPGDRHYKLAAAVAYFEMNDESKSFELLRELRNDFADDADLEFLYILSCQNSHHKEVVKLIEKKFATANEDFIKFILFRIAANAGYRSGDYGSVIEFFYDRIKEGTIPTELQAEFIYYVILMMIEVENYTDAGLLFEKLTNLRPSFLKSDDLKLYINMRNKNYNSSEIAPFQDVYHKAFESLIPPRLLFNASGLKTNDDIDINDFFESVDDKLVLRPEFGEVTVDGSFQIILEYSPTEFLSYCRSASFALGYRVIQQFPGESEGLDILAQSIANKKIKAILVFSRFTKDTPVISDIFLDNILAVVAKNRADKAILITNASLTEGAEMKINAEPKLEVLTESALINLFRSIHLKRTEAILVEEQATTT